MIKKDCNDAVDYNSQKVSDIIRQMSFAGIAIIWLFTLNGGKPANVKIDQQLILPAVLFMITFLLDFLQFTIDTVIFQIYDMIKIPENSKVPVWQGWICFTLKAIAIIWAYWIIIMYLKSQLL